MNTPEKIKLINKLMVVANKYVGTKDLYRNIKFTLDCYIKPPYLESKKPSKRILWSIIIFSISLTLVLLATFAQL